MPSDIFFPWEGSHAIHGMEEGLLGFFMMFLYTLPDASSGTTMGGLNMNQVGIVFLVIGIGMIVLGWFLRK